MGFAALLAHNQTKGDGHVHKVNCQSCVFSVVSGCFIRLSAVWVRLRDNRILRPSVCVLLRADNRVLRPSGVYVLLRAGRRILCPSVYVLLCARILPSALCGLLRPGKVILLWSALLCAALAALVVQCLSPEGLQLLNASVPKGR